MFIDILGHGASNKEVRKYFQHFESIVSLCFQRFLAAMSILPSRALIVFALTIVWVRLMRLILTCICQRTEAIKESEKIFFTKCACSV